MTAPLDVAQERAAARESPPGAAHSLDAVFRPRSIAVIGASRERGTIGAEIFHNLIERGFQGPVYPVNPKATAVHSVLAYPTIEAVPGAVDLAVVVVPAAVAVETIEACGRKGVKAAVVISAGFKETGPEGAERERALLRAARAHGMRLIGPNCLGVLNTEPAVSMNATFAPTDPPAGRVAFSSQSGALGLAILEVAAQLNLGISHFVSVGNKADVSGTDLLEYWEHDPSVDVILLYLESFGNPKRFTPVARRVARRKPVVAVKSGRTAAGVRAAASHTGSLAGTDAAVNALCHQTGIIRTDTIEELFDVAMLVAHQPISHGNRVAIVTNAGGPGIMASDACESHGLVVPALDPATVAALRAFLPREASTHNPVDMIASAAPTSFERAVPLVLEDPNIDAALVIYVAPMVTRPLDVAQAIARGVVAARDASLASGRAPKPVLTCFMGSHGVPDSLRSLQEGRIPSYAFPESAAIALARTVQYARWLETPPGRVPEFDDVRPDEAAAALARAAARAGEGASWLDPDEVRAALSAYCLELPPLVVARDAEAAAAAVSRLGVPAAIKLRSSTVTHKSDVGGVVLDVRTPDEARVAFRDIAERMREAGLEGGMDGVIVQPMIRSGVEVIVGVTQDPSFGPLVMFGMGGVRVELLQDVAFRIHPLTDQDAHAMVREVRGYRMLEGWRGAPPADVAALEQVLLRVSQLVRDQPTIAEMDLNPIKVLRPGRGCVVVDARIAVRRA